MTKLLTLFYTLYTFVHISGFQVYWNVPTQECQKFHIDFNLKVYNIIQNTNDKFYGNKITIIYNPGQFPYFKDDGTPIWGGIPQKANAMEHLNNFRTQVNRFVPVDFEGYAVLDFESYQPYYDIAPYIYKKASMDWIRTLEPSWSNDTVSQFAKLTFDQSTEYLFGILLEAGKVLRPGAKWGYYHYPYCRNPSPGHPACNPQQIEANAGTSWFFQESDVLYPSIYITSKNFDIYTTGEKVQARLTEALERRKYADQPILPYFRFKYIDDMKTYLEPMDLWSTLGLVWYNKLEGAIIWGSFHDVESEEDCIALKNYLKNYLGPLVKFLTTFAQDQY